MPQSAKRVRPPEADPSFDALAREIDTIARYIDELRAAINGLGVLDLTETKLTEAQVDINDVILQTRSTTDTILETAESLIAAPQTGDDYRNLVEGRMIALMEACSFQDLTGQRLTRVAHTLSAMDERLRTFATAAKVKRTRVRKGEREKLRDAWMEQNIVYGPGGENAVDQDTVDWLMATSQP
jgi:chemotaxis protein CheZ